MKNLGLFLFLVCSPFILFSQGKNTWTPAASFSAGVSDNAIAFAVGGNGYAGLGTDNAGFRKDFWKYSSENNKWEKAEELPAHPRISAIAFSIGSKGYVGTGRIGSPAAKQGTDDFWEYDTEKKSWSQKANFPGGVRYAAVGFSIGSKGYISLGANQNTYYNDLWEYNPASNQWSKKSPFPEAGRIDASAFVIGNEAFILFGQGKELMPSKKVSWKYSAEKNEWKQFAEFPDAARVGAVAFSFQNKGYVMGGTNGGLKRFHDFWSYDATRDRWSGREDLPFGSFSYGFSFVAGNTVYVCNGKLRGGTNGSEVWKLLLDEKQTNGNNLIIGGNLLLGDERIPLAGIEVRILNTKNEVVKSVFTNLFGSFLLSGLSETEDLILTFDSNDPGWKNERFYIVNRKNENVAILNKDNSFKFYLNSTTKNKIQLIKVENKNLRMNMKGKLALDDKKKTPLENVVVSLINEDDQVVQAGVTDKNGNFIFNYLPVDSTVYLSVDEKMVATISKGAKILLLDEGDNLVSKTTTAHPEFELINLPPERNTLSQVYMEDPWLESIVTNKTEDIRVIELVYFEVGKWDILPDAKTVLNRAVTVLKNNPKYTIEIAAHTDSRGDAKSNQELSEKRAASAKEYMTAKGALAGQILTKGYGESQLINRCKDGVSCTEEEHAQNRRMEFTVKRK